MMSKAEIGKLLLLASGLDRFVQVDTVTVDAWWRVLSEHDGTYEMAESACIAHYTGPDAGRPFSVAHVVAVVASGNRSAQASIEADVRSAKARGMVSRDWPERELLPAEIRAQLAVARDESRATAQALPIEAGGSWDA
jgi:hypothetical protein